MGLSSRPRAREEKIRGGRPFFFMARRFRPRNTAAVDVKGLYLLDFYIGEQRGFIL
jgi:hypothetical protein